jgi:hypothetical protein
MSRLMQCSNAVPYPITSSARSSSSGIFRFILEGPLWSRAAGLALAARCRVLPDSRLIAALRRTGSSGQEATLSRWLGCRESAVHPFRTGFQPCILYARTLR